MALNAREIPPLPLGGNSSFPLVTVGEADDMPFDDDQTSIAEWSNGSADIAMLEARMALETNLVAVAEAKARQRSSLLAKLAAPAQTPSPGRPGDLAFVCHMMLSPQSAACRRLTCRSRH